MASGKGCTAALHSVYGDTIPKEYHRRVLKKIAQLTKVIYSLHTKNDENEEKLEALTVEHVKEKEKLQLECSAKVKEWNEERNRNQDLKNKIATLEEEKTVLVKEHSDFADSAEQRLQTLMQKENQKLVEVKSELNHLKEQVNEKDKEHERLQKELTNTVEESERVEKHMKEEVESLKEQNEKTVDQFKRDLQCLKLDHENTLAQLNSKHREEMESLQNTMVSKRDSVTQLELQRAEEKYKALEMQMSCNESKLSNRLSTLSSELAKIKDDLAISLQRERELEDVIRKITSQGDKEKTLLKQEKQISDNLQLKLSILENDISLLRETLDTQNKDMKKMAGHVDQLESIKMQLEKDKNCLELQLEDAAKKVKNLEKRRQQETDDYKQSTDETSRRVLALEEEIEKLSLEKKHLHAQFAREIEAAYASVSDNEAAVNESHMKRIQEMQDQHKAELEQFELEKQREVKCLMEDYESRLSMQENAAAVKYREDMENISSKLDSRMKDLSEVRTEMDDLRSIMAERERELRSANMIIDKLREETLGMKKDASDKDSLQNELQLKLTQLQMTLDAMKTKYEQALISHEKKMCETEIRVKDKTEKLWKNKMMSELSALREDLESQHLQNQKSALNKMAELSDSTLKDHEDKWSKENNKLKQQIKDLQKELDNMKYCSEAALCQLKTQYREEMDELRYEYKQQLGEADLYRQELISSHSDEVEVLKNSLEQDKQKAIDEMNELHQKELSETHQANRVAMEALRNVLLKKGEEEKESLTKTYQEQLDALQIRMNKNMEEKLEEVKLQFAAEQENTDKIAKGKINSLNSEISHFKDFQSSLETQLSECKEELSKTRHRVDLLTIELTDNRKQLDMKEREIQMTLLETRNQLKVHEEKLVTAHHAEVESLICHHKHQSQMIVNEFNKAKDILTRKLHHTEKRLQDAELKYKSRDSRPEDVAAIKELKSTVKEYERKIKELTTEKKMYQLELVNREKNYNKVFNANPQIGVLDPLKGRKKSIPTTQGIQSVASLKFSSAPNLISSKFSETNSFPSIASVSSIHSSTSKDHSSPQLTHAYPRRSPLPFTRSISHNPPSSPNDFELPGIIPSPRLHNHQTKNSTMSSSSPMISSKRSLKFLSDAENELIDRTNPKNSGVPLQPSVQSTILA